MGYKLSKGKRKDVNDIIRLIKRMECNGPKEFTEIARGLGYTMSFDGEYPKDATIEDVLNSMNDAQKRVLNALVSVSAGKGGNV